MAGYTAGLIVKLVYTPFLALRHSYQKAVSSIGCFQQGALL